MTLRPVNDVATPKPIEATAVESETAVNADERSRAERVAALNARFRPNGNIVPLRDDRADDRLAALIDDAQTVLREAITNEFAGKIALVSSFGAESAVLLHLLSSVAPDTPVIFLETGKHFAQTLSYRKKIAKEFGLTNIQDIKPSADEVSKDDPNGDLWRTNPDACCALRKVRPLAGALSHVDAWVTGRKQFHGGARVSLPVFEETKTHIKVNPLARWTQDDVTAYFERHDLPTHALVDQGFPSIGCWPCTKPARDDEDVRAGRWRGSDKTECGIHSL
ncbi:MAG: phosphoadenylyl-sulfate reductase [Pseudomonadota bacterium]